MKKGWEIKTLGDVCAFDKAQGTHRGLPYVGLEHIESHTARFIGSTDAQPVRSSTFRFSDKHVLYGRLRPYLNKALAPDFEGHCSTEIFPLKPSNSLSREYLLYWLLAGETCDRINATCTGARMPRAQMNEVMGFEFPLPPLAEQHRIVGLLDEAFEGIATAKANAEKNLQNARALFESHLQSVFSQRGEGWVEKPLGEIAEFKNGLNYSKNSKGQTLPVVGVANFQDNYYVPHLDLESATIDGKLAENYSIQRNDILTVRSNGSKHLVGRCMLVSDAEEMVSYSGFIIRIRYDATKLFPEYLLHFMKCQATRDLLTQGGGGANITNINQEKLSSLPVPFPSYPEQKRIAGELDALREETQRLATLYTRKLAALEALKKSLLHQAFSGEL